MTFDSSSALRFGQGFFSPNLVATEHFYGRLTPGWPLTPSGVASKICQQTSWGGVASKNMPTNLMDTFPTPMPSFSSIPQSIAGHTHTLHYFSNIDVCSHNFNILQSWPDPLGQNLLVNFKRGTYFVFLCFLNPRTVLNMYMVTFRSMHIRFFFPYYTSLSEFWHAKQCECTL